MLQTLSHSARRRDRVGTDWFRLPKVAAFWLVMAASLVAQTLPGRARAGNSSTPVLVQKGQAALDSGDFAAATALFEEAHRTAPERKDAVAGLMLAYLQGRRVIPAVMQGMDAVQHWPQDADLHHYLGLAYFQQERLQDADRELKQAAALAPRDAGIQHSNTHGRRSPPSGETPYAAASAAAHIVENTSLSLAVVSTLIDFAQARVSVVGNDRRRRHNT